MSGDGELSPTYATDSVADARMDRQDNAAEQQLSAAVDPAKLRQVFNEIDTDGGGARPAQQNQAAAALLSLPPRRRATGSALAHAPLSLGNGAQHEN